MGATQGALRRTTRIWIIPYRAGQAETTAQKEYRSRTGRPTESSVVFRQDGEEEAGNHGFGECRVYLDGQRIVTTHTKEDTLLEITFKLYDGTNAKVAVMRNTSWLDLTWKFKYRLLLNDVVGQTLNESSSKALTIAKQAQQELNDFKQPSSHPHDVVITASTTSEHIVQSNKEDYVTYEVTVHEIQGEKVKLHIVLRRFSDFCLLDTCIRSSWLHHLHFSVETLPKLPPKRPKTLENHLNPTFIETRRHALDVYLKHVLKLPDIYDNPDVLAFLGMLPPLDDLVFSVNDNQNPIAADHTTSDHAVDSLGDTTAAVPTLDKFDSKLASIDDDSAELICTGSAQQSQDCMSTLVSNGSLETFLQIICKEDNVEPLLFGFDRIRRDKQLFIKDEFNAWVENQLPNIADVVRERVQQVRNRIEPKQGGSEGK